MDFPVAYVQTMVPNDRCPACGWMWDDDVIQDSSDCPMCGAEISGTSARNPFPEYAMTTVAWERRADVPQTEHERGFDVDPTDGRSVDAGPSPS